jgi:hypothetical protein
MAETLIKLGQCFMSRFSKTELPVRIERNNLDGGWFACALTHGRIVQIKDESQLLYKLTDDEIRDIAQGVIPNRRSANQGVTFHDSCFEANNEMVYIPLRKIKRFTLQKIIIVERLNILGAAERVLDENEMPMTTREIVAAAKLKQYWTSEAATPWATLHAAISRDIKTKKDKSRFVKKERGKFSLR